jgi:hypothetical protein
MPQVQLLVTDSVAEKDLDPKEQHGLKPVQNRIYLVSSVLV